MDSTLITSKTSDKSTRRQQVNKTVTHWVNKNMVTFDFKYSFQRATYFAFYGPLVGLLLIVIGLFLAQLLSTDQPLIETFAATATVLIFGLLFTYLFGALPALLTGFISSFAKTRVHEVAFSLLGGAATSMLFSILSEVDTPVVQSMAIIGLASGVVCDLMFDRRRSIRSVRIAELN